MIKLQALENFTLERFDEIQDIERAGKEQKNWINKNDIFKCSKDLADYLLGENPLKRSVVKVVEVEPKMPTIIGHRVDDVEYVIPLGDKEKLDKLGEEIMKHITTKKKKSSKK